MPDSGIVIVRSKAWTQAEREAMYLAATRFRLSGQWSKIREMMNLHRTDKEIEEEYKKLYGHRDSISDDEDNDDDHHDDNYNDDMNKRMVCSNLHKESPKMGEDRFGQTDGDADDEAESAVFMKFGGSRHSGVSQTHHLHHHQQGQQGQDGYEHQRIFGQTREPIRLHMNELMIDKHFVLEEIPLRL
ncbi:hypothetical protein BGZ65_006568 [Modicella reniformis]|uniref:Myb-like domain-containing protein n=1 Tax=Modicella reniformis TaxID=1440133 RepID=A0A9P6LXP6_9FUNG|nr:hypothetical protein BGZ65_006568 [Modicella reniformis]